MAQIVVVVVVVQGIALANNIIREGSTAFDVIVIKTETMKENFCYLVFSKGSQSKWNTHFLPSFVKYRCSFKHSLSEPDKQLWVKVLVTLDRAIGIIRKIPKVRVVEVRK